MEADAGLEAGTATSPSAVEDPYTGHYEWVINHFSKLTEPKEYSEKFEIGTHYWRLLIFPRGNKQHTVSVYLDAPEAPYTPMHLSPKASFRLVLVNQRDETKNYVKDSSHTFTPQEADWGFTQFIAIDELSPDKGYLMNDTLILRCSIRIQRDERYSYDSRKETGFVGLKNQGATCYMNSLLQYLYMIPYFRKAVYHMPTLETDEPAKCLPLALQSVFYKLQYSNTAVSTKDLTKSFGWGTYDAFMQHDVQELNRVLCEKLEEKMKGTRVEKAINYLFEGSTINYIKCVNITYESTRKESYMDLQLDVKGCKDIYASFDKYTEEELLDGQNQYNAEGHGLQDAKKGVLFESFPRVLQLQLKRFEYDFMRDTMVKINDHYEFYEELDLDRDDHKYLSPNADKSVRNLYRLHSVLIHSGGVHGGHYYAYSSPDGKTWLKFDDDRVTIEDKAKALNEQFGESINTGNDDDLHPLSNNNPPHMKFAKYSSAYMLVYVRESEWEHIMCPVNKEDIAEHLRKRLEAEQEEKEQRQKQKAEAHLYCTLKVATDTNIHEQIGQSQYFDLVNHMNVPQFRMKKQTKFSEFKAEVANTLGIPVDKQRFWTWHRRPDTLAYRPGRPLTPAEEALTLMDLREHREQSGPANKHALMDLKFYLETPKQPGGKLMEVSNKDILVFFKYYEPQTEKLSFSGRLTLHNATCVSELIKLLCAAANLPEGTPLYLFVEVRQEPSVAIEILEPNATFKSMGFKSGEIICFQRALTEAEVSTYRCPYVKTFLEYTRARRVVKFCRVDEPKEVETTLELQKDMNYDQVTSALAATLNVHAANIRLTQHNTFLHQPHRTPIRFRGLNDLESMLKHAGHFTDTLYFEVLDMPLEELEQLKTLKIAFHNGRADFVKEYKVSLPRDSSVERVLEELRGLVGPEYADKPLRLLEMNNANSISRVYNLSESIDTINENYWSLRAEVDPLEEQQARLEEETSPTRLIQVCHFNTDKEGVLHVTNFGDPFYMVVTPDTSVGELRAKIQAKLEVPPEDFATWRTAYITQHAAPDYLSDSDLVLAKFVKTGLGSTQPYIGLQHEDKGPKRPQASSNRYVAEKAIKICG